MGPTIRAAALAGYADLARSVGLDPLRMLDAVGIPRAALDNPDIRISNAAARELAEMCGRTVEDFGLRVSELRSPSLMGPVALIAREQPNVRAVIEAISRHIALHNELLAYRLEDFSEVGIVRVSLRSPSSGPARQSWELTLAMLVKILRQYLGDDWRPLTVSLVHGPPASLHMHFRIFGPGVAFNQDFYGIACSREDLDRPNPAADPALAREVERYLQTLGGSKRSSLRERVRALIEAMLFSGLCNIDFVARQMGCDVRTLQRKLAEEGVSFVDILQDTRRTLADVYIAQSDRPISDVAELLGFSAVSAFSRWHRTHFGLSPTGRRSGARGAVAGPPCPA